jgi:hypothetical protein
MEARPKNADASGNAAAIHLSKFGVATGHWTATPLGRQLLGGSPQKLGQMMGLAQEDATEVQDLRSIFRQQLTEPMNQTVCCPTNQPVRTQQSEMSQFSLANLLSASSPSLDCLGACKDYAKACLQHPDRRLPQEIARVIYFACIAAALLRCRQRITKLEDGTLMEAFRWCLEQDWCLEELSALFQEAIGYLKVQATA